MMGRRDGEKQADEEERGREGKLDEEAREGRPDKEQDDGCRKAERPMAWASACSTRGQQACIRPIRAVTSRLISQSLNPSPLPRSISSPVVETRERQTSKRCKEIQTSCIGFDTSTIERFEKRTNEYRWPTPKQKSPHSRYRVRDEMRDGKLGLIACVVDDTSTALDEVTTNGADSHLLYLQPKTKLILHQQYLDMAMYIDDPSSP
ncbi:hypothetical protein B0T20DRAFT_395386 [Sordaria brevicollis]|uniref:Uncharacterized protein n=1 Tax=Sordaria brevicollis TaxID=83679 RepID=A0AAE0P8Y7_SORBR|nr:hypothetical protein B0T20DRAFT_395386 [Sordaria brevicollis]